MARLRTLGLKVEGIARRLERSAATIRRQLESVHAKLGVHTDVELAQRVLRAEAFLRS